MSKNGVLGPFYASQEVYCINPKESNEGPQPDSIPYSVVYGALHFAFVWGACNNLDLGTLEEGHDEGTC
jgi:hypothetical protein